ncbi:AraC family transcriptional regulator [uncultured Alcanivorax sp.]|uniref:AraC family transcriptional regulator n=1 Tax=uncultured Alcanivorax sp. TaxID=191215 RepID=UPI002624A99E|nr:AraC family transcriptional regulator [uncultured Alcanivorax sp.]
MNQPMEWALSINYLRQVADQLTEMGIDVAPWLAAHDLSLADLEQADASVPWEVVRALFLEAEAITGEPALGLMVGERLRINNHGMVGYAAMNSGSVRQVVELLERFIPLRINLVMVSHQVDGKYLNLQIRELLPLGEVGPFLLGAVVVAVKNVLDFITLGNCQVAQASFTFAEAFDRELVRSLFRCPVRYNQGWTGLSLPLNGVDQPLRTADPAAFEHAEKLCERELQNLVSDVSVSARVRRLMLAKQVNFPSLTVTARILHMTPRTLHRRLLDEGTSFQEILDEVRHALAMEYLKSQHMTIQELAYTLGYGDTANFRRAFKRWTGVAPSFFRENSEE